MEKKNNMATTEIKDTFYKLIDLVSKEITDDLKNNTLRGDSMFKTILAAYNLYMINTCYDPQCIYNIEEKEDVIYCLKEYNVTMAQMVDIFMNADVNTPYFTFAEENYKPVVFKTINQLKEKLIKKMKFVITHIFVYENDSVVYKEIFKEYVGTLF